MQTRAWWDMAISTRKTLAALASIITILCLAAFTIRVSSAQQGTQPASAFSGAVWVAESLGLVKLSSTDGSFVFKIAGSGEAKALALDGKRGRAWVYLKGELRAYGFDGSLLVTVFPPLGQSAEHEGDDDDENGHPAIGVVPETGSVWLALNKRLYQFDTSGKLIYETALSENAVSLSMDDAAGTAWVFSKKSAVAYTPSGVPAGQIVFGKKAEVRDGCFDGKSASLWVATKETVRKYSTGGALLAERKIKKAGRVTASGLGGVWVGGEGEVYLLDQSGAVVLSEQVGGHESKAGAMALNPADFSLWASFGKNLVHITPSGQVAHYLEIEGKIRALAVYADIEPPVIKFTAPVEGSVTNSLSPSIELAYSDTGSGVDTNSLSIKYNNQPFAGTCQAAADKAVCSPSTPIAEGLAGFEATISDNAGNISSKATLNFTIDATPPAITLTSPSDGALTRLASATVAGSVSERSDVTVTITSAAGAVANPVTLNADLIFTYGPVTLTEGGNTFSISATDPAGNMGSARAVVTLDTTPPAPVAASSVTISNPVNGLVAVSGAAGSAEAMATVKITNLRTGQVVTIQAGADGSFTASIAAKPTDQLTISLADSLGNVSQDTSVVTPGTLFTASPIDPTAPTNIADAVSFLYTGPDAVQTGVAPGAIDSRFVAVLRGKVSDAGGQPLAGVAITVNGHPEYGQTATRDDGMFDIAVNGGSPIAVNYRKQGYLPVQRMIDAPWRDYAWAPDVTMIQLDPKVTTIDLTAPATQVAQGSVMTDQDGSRQATMVFNPGTTATITLPDGTTQQLTTLNVRATEYTVGPNGPSAMPGELPPSSAYTYAVEYSVDEAIAQNAKEVSFNQPVPLYVDNFLNFPVGDGIPIGFYNHDQAAWIPSDDGFVIKILGVTGGLADIDLEGTGLPATAAKLASLYFTDAERQKLATMYQPGKTLWRGFTTHFSPWDWNKALILPGDSANNSGGPANNPPPPCDCPPTKPGSVIEPANQTLGEEAHVSGTSYKIAYRADRTPGRKSEYTTEIEVSGATVPASLQGIVLEINIAGQKFTYNYPAQPNITHTFTWDGKDAYGRPVQGKVDGLVRTGYQYRLLYADDPAPYGRKNFASPSTIASLTGPPGRQSTLLWKSWNVKLGTIDARGQGLGGWSLDAHHVYDPVAKTVYKGDGTRVGGTNTNSVIKIVAGSSANNAMPGDGVPATTVLLYYVGGMTIGKDNSLYFSEYVSVPRIRKVAPDGIITTIAGAVGNGFAGDGGPAAQAKLYNPMGIASGPDGSLYIADMGNNRVRKIDKNGIITTVAGNGQNGCSRTCTGPYVPMTIPGGGVVYVRSNCTDTCGDNGPATNAVILPTGVAVAPDGTLYIAEYNANIVHRVDKNGKISIVAGQRWPIGFSTDLGDGGPAANSTLYFPRDVALDKQGNLYIADTYNHRVRKVTPDGKINTVAGFGATGYTASGFSGDGGPATGAKMYIPWSVFVMPDGSLGIMEYGNRVVRVVNQDGIINTVAGMGTTYTDGSLAYNAYLFTTGQWTRSPNGEIYMFVQGRQIARITNAMPGFNALDYAIPSEDGSTLWRFDRRGKHLQTNNALTGAVITTFGYDAAGKLITVTDGDGNVTTIQRDGAGNATGIVSQYGVKTALTLNANGYLASVTDPGGNVTRYTYSADGLMASMTDANNGAYTFTHDAMGKLTKDQNPVGGGWTLTSSKTKTTQTSSITSAEGRTDTTLRERLATGGERLTMTSPSGATSVILTNVDGTSVSTSADGTVTTTSKGPDPRFGMMSPTQNITMKTPSGLTMTTTATRAVTLSNPADPLSVSSITDTQTVNAKSTRSTFNKAAMTFTITSPTGKQVTSKIDQQGRVTQSQVSGILPVQYSYDLHGRVSSATQGTRVRSYSYDALDNVATVTDPMGQAVSFTYDAALNTKSETLPDGRAIGYSYDPNRNVTSVTPPSRPAHGFSYTPVDLQSAYTPPVAAGSGLNATSFAYNLDKQVASVTRPDGKVETYSYDTAGRMIQVSSPDGNVVYTYGSGGSCCGNPDLLKSGTFTPTGGSSQTIDYAYDGTMLTTTTWSGVINGSVARTYDNFFRITSRSVTGGAAITQTYDNDGYLSSSGAMTITRDLGNGNITGTTLGSVTTARAYSGYGETATTTAKYAASTLASVQYTRDALGRITKKAETIQGVTDTYDYTYDTTGRLTGVVKNGVTLSAYTFDGNNNRLTYSSSGGVISATYDAQDRLLTYGANSYTYTADGELTAKTANAQTTSYTYDTFGNLTAVSLPDGTRIDYLIDSQGRRVGKKVNGTLTQGWLYKDGLKPIAELDGTGTLVSQFVYGTMANVPDYIVKGGITYRIISDHLGSPRLVVNIADGSIAQRMDYDEYGNILTDTNPGFQPLGFAGGLYDVNTKLTRFGARDYDAETGRWTSKDPIGFDGGDTNLYGYVLNDPVNWVDMNGKNAAVIPTVVAICLLNPEICAAIPPLVYCTLFPEACGLPPHGCPQNPPMLEEGGDSSDGNERDTQRETKTPKEGARGKEGATDAPSWAKGKPPYKGESGREYADRLMDGKYGKGNYPKGAKTEHSKIQKYGARHWE